MGKQVEKKIQDYLSATDAARHAKSRFPAFEILDSSDEHFILTKSGTPYWELEGKFDLETANWDVSLFMTNGLGQVLLIVRVYFPDVTLAINIARGQCDQICRDLDPE